MASAIMPSSTPPTIANGKVYVGTFSGQLLVYGLNSPAADGINFIQANAVTAGASTLELQADSQSLGWLNDDSRRLKPMHALKRDVACLKACPMRTFSQL